MTDRDSILVSAGENVARRHDCEITVLMPCLNEERTVGECVRKAMFALERLGIAGEVLVIDNGSGDMSAEIAERVGARVVHERVRGYGSALRRGIREARGKYVIMGDADCTYDFSEIGGFVDLLERGVDLVVGNRMGGRIWPGAMPWLHRCAGTPCLTAILNRLYRVGISDVNCGLRGFKRASIESLHLECRGMEFASEMLMEAAKHRLSIQEIPIDYRAAPVKRTPNLRTFRDGWRHLRLILLGSPRHLFLLPGLFAFLVGLVLTISVVVSEVVVFDVALGLSTAVFANGCLLIGVQAMLFGMCALAASEERLRRRDALIVFLRRHFSLERGLVAGVVVVGGGVLLGCTVAVLLFRNRWCSVGVNVFLTKLAALSVFTVLMGTEILFASMYVAVLDRKRSIQ